MFVWGEEVVTRELDGVSDNLVKQACITLNLLTRRVDVVGSQEVYDHLAEEVSKDNPSETVETNKEDAFKHYETNVHSLPRQGFHRLLFVQ